MEIITGDCLEELQSLEAESVHCCMTSPPYWNLRDYGHDDQLGLEEDSDDYVQNIADVIDEVKRVLRPDGSLWLNLGDSYATNSAGNYGESSDSMRGNYQSDSTAGKYDKSNEAPTKSKLLIPQKVAIELQSRGYIIRNDIIWHKPNKGIPESVSDRFTRSYEFLFHIPMSQDYYFDMDVAKDERGVILPDVWHINSNTDSTASTNFATYPKQLCEKPIKATCPKDGVVLDPFAGAGTTLLKAKELGRDAIGIELNPEYADMARARVGLEPNDPANVRDDDGQNGLEDY